MFVYAVSSTRVYCRPTCPSRRPRPDRVTFFARPEDAASAGFRPCKRCRPDNSRALDPAVERVRATCGRIARSNPTRIPLRSLAKASGVGEHQLLRTFKRVIGITPREYADAIRTGSLKSALRSGNGVADAGFAAGYGSGSRVYERAASVLGMTPARYAAGAKGETVKYTIARSSIGHVLVAATARGICSVTIGSDPAALERGLRTEFSEAALERTAGRLSASVNAIIGSIEGTAPDPRLPLDVRATAFQTRVWRELQRIPRGVTRSYEEVARRVGRPGAARAVARACASNPVALVIPCHRVVRANGMPGGYRWGAARKESLLASERR
jgi:AraC family transcriptional regulator, regulatory protein of adaptative response / methylated-DNA-[protein]-cysteine methyltransferase